MISWKLSAIDVAARQKVAQSIVGSNMRPDQKREAIRDLKIGNPNKIIQEITREQTAGREWESAPDYRI